MLETNTTHGIFVIKNISVKKHLKHMFRTYDSYKNLVSIEKVFL